MDPRLRAEHGRAVLMKQDKTTYEVITVDFDEREFLQPDPGHVTYYEGFPVFRRGNMSYIIVPDINGKAFIYDINDTSAFRQRGDRFAVTNGKTKQILVFPAAGFESSIPDSHAGYNSDGTPIFMRNGLTYHFETIRTDRGTEVAAFYNTEFKTEGGISPIAGTFPWMITAFPEGIRIVDKFGTAIDLTDPTEATRYTKYKTPDVFVKWLETGEPVFRLDNIEYYFINAGGFGKIVKIEGISVDDESPIISNAAYLPRRFAGMWLVFQNMKKGVTTWNMGPNVAQAYERAKNHLESVGVSWRGLDTYTGSVYLWLSHLHLNGVLSTDANFTWDVSYTWPLPGEPGGTISGFEYPTWDPYENKPNYNTGLTDYLAVRLVCKKDKEASEMRRMFDEYTQGKLIRPVDTDNQGYAVGTYIEAQNIYYSRGRFPMLGLHNDANEKLLNWHAQRWFCYYVIGHVMVTPSENVPEASISEGEFMEFKRFFWAMPPNEIAISLKSALALIERLGYNVRYQTGIGLLGAMTSTLAMGYMVTDFSGRFPIHARDLNHYEYVYPVFKIDEPSDTPLINYPVNYGGKWFQWNIHSDRVFLIRNREGTDNVANLLGNAWKIGTYQVDKQFMEWAPFGIGIKNFARNPITTKPVGSDANDAKLFKYLDVNRKFPMPIAYGALGLGIASIVIGGGMVYEGVPVQLALIVGGSIFIIGTAGFVLAYLPQLLNWISGRLSLGGSAAIGFITGQKIYDS